VIAPRPKALLWTVLLALGGPYELRLQAQNIDDGRISGISNDCHNLIQNDRFPSPPPADKLVLERKPAALYEDSSTRSSFETWRASPLSGRIRVAVCFADVRITTSRDADKIHLSIALKQELPKGVTVGSYVQWLGNVPAGEVFVKIPKQYRPQVLLELPNGMASELELAEGTVDPSGNKGSDTKVNVAKGGVFLRSVARDYFNSIAATFAVGGLKTSGDMKNSDLQWSKSGSSWSANGTGTHNLAIVIGYGHLYLLH
jgi:hypothetical protein